MSTAEATLYGAIIAGTFALLGAVVGVLIERVLRSWGRVRCEASLTKPLLLKVVDETEPGYPRAFELEVPALEVEGIDANTAVLAGVSYECAVELFNGLELPTSLRGVAMAFVYDDGRRELDYPDDPKSERRDSRGHLHHDKLAVLNLQPHQVKRVKLKGEFGKDAAHALKAGRWKQIMFEAQRPKRPLLWRRTYRKIIADPRSIHRTS